jgi:murein DD-endopeptidase MepM/ murein hydrolase activator NlpD
MVLARTAATLALLGAVLALAAFVRVDAQVPHAVVPVAEPQPQPEPEPRPAWVSYTVRRGDTLSALMPRFGVRSHEVREAALEVHDLAKLRIGRELSFLVDVDGVTALAVRYPLDADRTLILDRTDEGWESSVDEVAYERRLGTRHLVVTSTLWEAAIEAGLRGEDVASMARVMQYDLDFNTQIRAGATADLVVQELWQDGELTKLGRTEALVLTNAGRSYTAMRFEVDGEAGYYDAEGVSRKGTFLRSPLAFSRVTSGFTKRRFHPILKRNRPHHGVDFGAPTGTPVRAVGDGTVTMAGTHGGHGRFVKLDHAGPHASSYSHLHRVLVKKGQKVRQGDLIGEVGSTGLATGPHLHYQFWVNDLYVDPMTVELPRTNQLTPSDMGAFEERRDAWLAMLESPAL